VELKAEKIAIRIEAADKKLFLRRLGTWTREWEKAAVFRQAVKAIAFCLRLGIRDIRLVARNKAGLTVYAYPFGGDPVFKAELKRVRKQIREGRRVRAAHRTLEGRMNMLINDCNPPRQRTQRPQDEYRRRCVGGE
jgi:hypothetical protein